MGAVKRYMMEREEIVGRLSSVLLILEDVSKREKLIELLVVKLQKIIKQVDSSRMLPSLVNQLYEKIEILEGAARDISRAHTKSELVAPYQKIRTVLDELCYPKTVSSKGQSLNTPEYYENLIKQLSAKELQLRESISKLNEETQQHKAVEEELKKVKIQKEKLEAEKEELQRRSDIQANIKNKIDDTFKAMKEHSAPLANEQMRLNVMFYAYACLSVFVCALLVWFEYHFVKQFNWTTQDRNLIDYLPFYLPVPLAAAALWGFIYQMNRAQRQLMMIGNTLYHAEYVEGLLLAVNSIIPDTDTAVSRICNVVDSMIKKYISIDDNISEERIALIEKKDNTISVRNLLALVKEIKEISDKPQS